MKPLCFLAICCSMTGLAQTLPTSSTPEAPDPDFRAGRMELRVSGGINAGSGREPLTPKTPPSAGVEGAVGLNRYVAVIGEYTYNALGHYTLKGPCLSPDCGIFQVEVKARIHEFLGGFRVSAANRSPVIPYGAFVIGVVRPSASAAAAGVLPLNVPGVGLSSSGRPTVKFAAGAGGGLNFRITRDFGIALDICAVKAMDLKWYLTPTVGVYIRFH